MHFFETRHQRGHYSYVLYNPVFSTGKAKQANKRNNINACNDLKVSNCASIRTFSVTNGSLVLMLRDCNFLYNPYYHAIRKASQDVVDTI